MCVEVRGEIGRTCVCVLHLHLLHLQLQSFAFCVRARIHMQFSPSPAAVSLHIQDIHYVCLKKPYPGELKAYRFAPASLIKTSFTHHRSDWAGTNSINDSHPQATGCSSRSVENRSRTRASQKSKTTLRLAARPPCRHARGDLRHPPWGKLLISSGRIRGCILLCFRSRVYARSRARARYSVQCTTHESPLRIWEWDGWRDGDRRPNCFCPTTFPKPSGSELALLP
jgi:hypothetical protein